MSKTGRFKFRFCRKLGQSHHDLADYLDIKQRNQWEKGRECWNILEWLEERGRLNELQEALVEIERQDLVSIAQEILSSIDMEDDLHGQDIVSDNPTPNELFTGIAQREAATCDLSRLTDERHKRIDYTRTLISQGQFNSAIQYLEALKLELWYQADSILKYRLLANYGMAKLGLDEIADAAAKFVEALQYNPEDDRAISYAAMGYVFQRDYTNAERLIEEALRRNPANELA
jgi:tetratricopeptide (TPR) repeat protein